MCLFYPRIDEHILYAYYGVTQEGKTRAREHWKYLFRR